MEAIRSLIILNREMDKSSKIYVAGHSGLVGSAITRCLKEAGYNNLIFKTINELDLTSQQAVDEFFSKEKPEFVFLAAAMVGGIVANNTYRADFIYNNIMIQSNVINACWKYGVKKLLFLGSTCIYPKNAPQPLKEDYLLSSKLEYTNEPYAVAKIAGLKMCEAFNIQYGTDFIAVMPTNLYGAGDNYNLERSHVLPALMRKIHLGKCLEDGRWDELREDLKKHPIESVNEDSSKEEIVEVLRKYGVEVKVEVKAEAEVERGREGEGERGRKGEGEMRREGEGEIGRRGDMEIGRKGEGERGRGGEKKVAVSVWGTGAPYREFMYSEDMARACIYIMENVSVNDIIKLHQADREPDYQPPHFINIGTGEEITIKQLAEKIKSLIGFRGEIVFDTSKPDGTMRKATDTRILKLLGFRHKYDLDAGLAETYEKYRS